jgi:hypothetical protein
MFYIQIIKLLEIDAQTETKKKRIIFEWCHPYDFLIATKWYNCNIYCMECQNGEIKC